MYVCVCIYYNHGVWQVELAMRLLSRMRQDWAARLGSPKRVASV